MGKASTSTQMVRIGGFNVLAEAIVAAPDSHVPGRLMGYRITGPRGNTHIVSVDHITGKPSQHELASLALWVATVNYSTKKIAERKSARAV